MSKYNSKKITRNGITFDSRKEYHRYCELLLLERAGLIADLRRQVTYELIPAQYESFPRHSEKTGKPLKPGKRCVEQSVTYIADFVYLDKQTGQTVVEDTKGMKTKDYIIKRKLMLWVHGIKISEV